MAQGATIYKAHLSIGNLDRGRYGDFSEHVLTIARHPSETEERLMLRMLAFAMHAGDRLEFGRGLSTEGEPALWCIDDTGAIDLWIELGTPDVKQVRKAAGRSAHVVILAYDEAKIEPWWASTSGDFGRIDKLSVLAVPDEECAALAAIASRNMTLSITIQDGVIWITDDARTLSVTPKLLKAEHQKYFD